MKALPIFMLLLCVVSSTKAQQSSSPAGLSQRSSAADAYFPVPSLDLNRRSRSDSIRDQIQPATRRDFDRSRVTLAGSESDRDRVSQAQFRSDDTFPNRGIDGLSTRRRPDQLDPTVGYGSRSTSSNRSSQADALASKTQRRDATFGQSAFRRNTDDDKPTLWLDDTNASDTKKSIDLATQPPRRAPEYRPGIDPNSGFDDYRKSATRPNQPSSRELFAQNGRQEHFLPATGAPDPATTRPQADMSSAYPTNPLSTPSTNPVERSGTRPPSTHDVYGRTTNQISPPDYQLQNSASQLAQRTRTGQDALSPPPYRGSPSAAEKVGAGVGRVVGSAASGVANTVGSVADQLEPRITTREFRAADGTKVVEHSRSYPKTLLMLFASIGLNLYLGWIAYDTYNRYQDLVADMRQSPSSQPARRERSERRLQESGAY